MKAILRFVVRKGYTMSAQRYKNTLFEISFGNYYGDYQWKPKLTGISLNTIARKMTKSINTYNHSAIDMYFKNNIRKYLQVVLDINLKFHQTAILSINIMKIHNFEFLDI